VGSQEQFQIALDARQAIK